MLTSQLGTQLKAVAAGRKEPVSGGSLIPGFKIIINQRTSGSGFLKIFEEILKNWHFRVDSLTQCLIG
jgi:hypothetical protein